MEIHLKNTMPRDLLDAGTNDRIEEKAMNHAAPELASVIAAKSNAATQQIGKHAETIGRSVRETVAPGGAIANAATSAASMLENTGSYLQDANIEN